MPEIEREGARVLTFACELDFSKENEATKYVIFKVSMHDVHSITITYP